MARVRRADTKPELAVRRVLHLLGYRFRLQWKAAPGTPDVAMPGRRKIIFVHGCFWHQHDGCPLATTPATRRDYWLSKFERNRIRDAYVLQRAEADGWNALVIWQCETRDPGKLATKLVAFLGPRRWPAASQSIKQE